MVLPAVSPDVRESWPSYVDVSLTWHKASANPVTSRLLLCAYHAAEGIFNYSLLHFDGERWLTVSGHEATIVPDYYALIPSPIGSNLRVSMDASNHIPSLSSIA